MPLRGTICRHPSLVLLNVYYDLNGHRTTAHHTFSDAWRLCWRTCCAGAATAGRGIYSHTFPFSAVYLYPTYGAIPPWCHASRQNALPKATYP